MSFVHLHVHSHFSMLDGAARIGDLLKKAKSFGMPALALTDHGNLHGAVEFYNKAREIGIKPILGIEAYISPTTRQDRSMGNQSDAAYHLILLAMNAVGWRNLMQLSSRAYLEGFYYKPRVDRELLARHQEGVIASSACLGGEIPTALLRNDRPAAERIAAEYLEIFGRDRFFIELMKQGEPDQEQVNPELASLARKLKIGLVGTNDVHFLDRQDKASHEVLTCISTGKMLTDATGMHYSPELYLKDVGEMKALFAEYPEAVENTLRINELCNVDMDFKSKHLPRFNPPDGSPPNDYMRKLAWSGLEKRFAPAGIPPEYRSRLDWELKVICDKGYSSYFLIVNDFVQYARSQNIPAAPRGSGVATLLGYSLGIADVDPLRYGLLFERFTDPQRAEDPDIDIDMCQEGREKVIQYVREKYGHVAQIITYGTLKARAAIRDVGRVMNIPLSEVDAIAKKIPDDPKITVDKALADEPELQRRYNDDPQFHTLIDHARCLQGLARNASVHAAGVVVCDEPLEGLVPLCRQKGDQIITQWDGPTCEKVGMMKMDFLGLRTLTIIQRARDLVRRTTGREIDPETLPLDDPGVFEIFRQGWTVGVFQFESEGMRNVLQKMQPNRIEDLIAANAMYRPGPMKLIDDYCNRKNGSAPVPPIHALIDDLLAETYGVMVYQEQVMQVVNRLGKLPLNRALTLIKAISKKKKSVIEEERPHFLKGAEENGINQKKAEELFALIEVFAEYGFNKAHSTRYAIVAYQTAYFKHYYPREFLAASLTFECGDLDKVAVFMADAERMEITVAPPDINVSEHDFTVDENAVRFGLGAVKGVGAGAVEAICTARRTVGKFEDLFHFCRSVDPRGVNRSTVEALIKCGAFDGVAGEKGHRAAMIAAIDSAIQAAQSDARDRVSGQMSFFDSGAGLAAENQKLTYPTVTAWTQDEMLAAEKDTLGFYVTNHPLSKYWYITECFNQPRGVTASQTDRVQAETPVGIGCMVTQFRTMLMKKGPSQGKKMAMFAALDRTGSLDCVMFADTFERFSDICREDALLFVTGTLDQSRERPSLRVDEVTPLAKWAEKAALHLRIKLNAQQMTGPFLESLGAVLRAYPGMVPVQFDCRPSAEIPVRLVIDGDHTWKVKPLATLLAELERLLGREGLDFEVKTLRPVERKGWSSGRPAFRAGAGR
jgi:DNA polymerase-3 subunit alpha